MLDSILIFFFFNLSCVSGLFWFLSFLGEKFFKKKNNRFSLEFFECGFLSNHSFLLKLNINIFFIFNLLILYDVEFLFLIPFFYNLGSISLLSSWVFTLFFYLILFSFFLDWSFISLNWHN